MSNVKLPVGAEAKNIGNVVTVQVFRRSAEDPGVLVLESLEKHVGNLQSYRHDKQGFTFRLVGAPSVSTSYKKQHVEIILSPINQ